jgi:hypothetical protein
MNLSTVLASLEQLREIKKQTQHLDTWTQHRDHITAMLQQPPILQSGPSDALRSALRGVESAFQDLDKATDDCVTVLINQQMQARPKYEQDSEDIYRANLLRTRKILESHEQSVEDVWDNTLAMSPDETAMIHARLDAFNDWRVPGLIIRPAGGMWMDRMVALDPLYLVDVDTALLRPSISKYPRLYQQRVRLYAIDEGNDRFLSRLPVGQIGIAVCFDLFHVRPLRILRQYLQNLWRLMKPGGMILLMYLDGDRSRGAEHVETGIHCFTPGSEVRAVCQALTFETVFEYQSPLGWNYLEIKRPGQISTLRGGQSLATIRPIR